MLKLKLGSGKEEDSSVSAQKAEELETKRKIKLNLSLDKASSNPVRIRLKTSRFQTEGYDVEAPDREEDPTVEEAIVLRMLPGVPALEKLHKACETNDFSSIEVKFEERRHAVVTVDGESFHAQLMDLPTITEVHKSIDRRNIFKTVDVSQILLVTHKVNEKAPDMQEYTKFTGDPQLFPHGLTPPLYNVRNRRFQQRMSTKAVESIEAQVEELLRKDAAAKEVRTELIPASAIAAQQALADAARSAALARAEESDDMEVDDELEEEIKRAMNGEHPDEGDDQDDDEDEDYDAKGTSRAVSDEDDDEDDDDDDDDDDDRPAGEHDEDDDLRTHNKQLREEIRELQVTIEAKEKVAGTVVNDIMRARHTDAVIRLKAELEKKKALLRDAGGAEKQQASESDAFHESDGDEDDDDDEDDDEEEAGDLTSQEPTSESLPSTENQASVLSQQNPDDEADRQLEAQLGEQLGDAILDDEDDIDSLF